MHLLAPLTIAAYGVAAGFALFCVVAGVMLAYALGRVVLLVFLGIGAPPRSPDPGTDTETPSAPATPSDQAGTAPGRS